MPVRVTIDGEGLQFTIDTELHKAGAVISFLTDSRQQNVPAVGNLGAPIAKTTPRQALIDLGASTNPEKIAAFIRYFADKESREAVTVKELEQTFARSGEPKPKNIHRDIQKAVSIGLIVESETQSGAYMLTYRGAELTQAGFRNAAAA